MRRRDLLLTPAAAVPMARAQTHTLEATALAAARRAIEAAIAARRLPGAVLWIERLGWPPSLQAIGLKAWEPSPEPLAPDVVYDVASLTKPVVTGTLATLLIERGRLQLDQPVQQLLPAFGGGHGVTVRHLLTHSSGLPAILPQTPDWSGAEAAYALACAAQPTQAPGSAFRYSDINYILLGQLIETLAAEPLAVLAEREIFRPLVMTDSGFRPRHPAERLVPTEFGDDGQLLRGTVHDPAARRMGGVAGHAGLFATAADLARFARCVLQGGAPLLMPASVALMTRPASPPGLPARGLGWDIASPYSRPRGALYPMGSFGHTGFTGCAMWLDPRSASFYVFLSNRVHPRTGPGIVDLYEEVGTWAARAARA